MTARRLGEDARRAVLASATAEAQRLGDRRIGTHHLLLALLHDPIPPTVGILGVDLAAARSLLTELDRAALAAIGIDAAPLDRTESASSGRRPPFTSGARNVLHQAVTQARADGSNRVEDRHLLRAILRLKQPDPAAQLLEALNIDSADALHRLANSER
jgi:ATP-dependent Clp protease ATP-binding subunit ClpA